ncbi:MAG: HTH domain-containing protein [bacterium]|nr:HTH domain-containing protein [bacterium]
MTTNTSQKIQEYLIIHKQVTSKKLAEYLGISRQALFKHLPKLLEEGKIGKIGKPPIVYYFIKDKIASEITSYQIQPESQLIENNYLIITPTGEKLIGMNGFKYWCNKNNLHIAKTITEYEKTFQKYAKYKKEGLINGTYKLIQSFDKVYVNKIFYLDFYSIERFGKTKLGWMLLYAKQSQNKTLIKEICEGISKNINKCIVKYNINAVSFVPPTVKREIQLMAEIEKNLNLHLPIINLQKIKTDLIVPQKTLSKIEDRVENARQTIMVNDNRSYNNILIIDDAIGSGATINETAKKFREKKIVKNKIYGLAITGSFKGFEIISEV